MEVTGEDVIRGLQRMKDDRDEIYRLMRSLKGWADEHPGDFEALVKSVQTEGELPVAPPALPRTAPQSIRRALRLIQGGKH
jgi:hypothetical protein